MVSSGESGWNRDDPVSESDFNELADNIGPDKWKDLARELKFNQANIDAIQQEKGKCKECCIEVLVRWRRRDGKEATSGKLAEALTKIGLKNLAENFLIEPRDTNRVSHSDVFFGVVFVLGCLY